MASKSEENRTWVTLHLVDTTVWYLKIQSLQTNAILHPHARSIFSHAFKVLDLNSSFWGRKLLLKLSDSLMNHHSGNNNSFHVPFVLASNLSNALILTMEILVQFLLYHIEMPVKREFFL